MIVWFSTFNRPGSNDVLHMSLKWQFGSTRIIENACLSQTLTSNLIQSNLNCYTKQIAKAVFLVSGFSRQSENGAIWAEIKVVQYSFFRTIPNFLNWQLNSLSRLGWMSIFHRIFFLDWSLLLCVFEVNRYFHGNDKQETTKSVNR